MGLAVPTFRVFYTERMPSGARDWLRMYGGRRAGEEPEETRHQEVEWEEEVEAESAPEALDIFFREHAPDRSQVMWVDEAGESREIRGLDYDPEKAYIWIEDDKLMEYQGMDEATPGMATCPLCGGQGEVVTEVAEEFLAEEEAAEEEGGA